ncbi:hypothetical protein CS022_18365 [Veronia nyctiphanis]|uniref:Rod shape-determining protein MreB n=1 Tax=Veronia nyctiphanis TaxID=1278244 RepID=A0A4Q0YMJ0_9GAMM|nr:rod shape-determining protein [Veronia nyctiphanis]RXJ71966.1 hypothetical protein CS022_18365 [Veronia nyctiphanis]
MQDWLRRRVSKVVYVQLWEERLKVIHCGNGKTFDEKPLLALRHQPKGGRIIAQIGNEAAAFSGDDIELLNPFSHPRTLISDMYSADLVIRHGFSKLRSFRYFVSPYVVVVHPMEKREGGVTKVEKAALETLFKESGAREVLVYEGEALDPENIDYSHLYQASIKDHLMDIKRGRKTAGVLAAVLGVYALALIAFFSING